MNSLIHGRKLVCHQSFALQSGENFVTQEIKEVGELSSSQEDMEWGAVSILSLRKTAGMTQAQLAGWLGVTIKQVKHLEHQRRNPSGPTSRLLDILAQQIGMGNGGRVQVLGADAGAPAEPIVEESGTEPAQEASPGQPDEAFVWQ